MRLIYCATAWDNAGEDRDQAPGPLVEHPLAAAGDVVEGDR
jgi:hypothetical protein